MGTSVILNDLSVLLLYGAALFFFLFDRHYHATKGRFTLLSVAAAIAATAVALLHGASLWEGAAALIVFLLLNTGVNK